MKIWQYNGNGSWEQIDLPMAPEPEDGDMLVWLHASGYEHYQKFGDPSCYGAESFTLKGDDADAGAGGYLIDFCIDCHRGLSVYCKTLPAYLLCLKNILFPLIKTMYELDEMERALVKEMSNQ